MEQHSNSYSYREIWKIAFPILISTIIEQVIGMTDAAFLGRVDEIALGASAIAGIYYMVIFMLGLYRSSSAGATEKAISRKPEMFSTTDFISPLLWP